MNATITTNPEFNGIEISFAEKPARCTLDALKAQGFRWHNKKALWYAKNSPERMEAAQAICDIGDYALQILAEEAAESRPAYGKGKKKAAEKPQPVNKYGVKVGDLFYTSWGYEQTNVNFFQVIGLKGETSVLVREVHPEMIEESAVSGMSADRRYKVTSKILPPSGYASFISDNENGDLRRVTLGYKDQPKIKVGRPGHYQETAYPYNGETLYESWYA